MRLGHGASRCQVPAKVYFVHESMDQVLPSIIEFLWHCGKELADFFGNVGTNTDMQQLLRNCGLCFDWQHLARQVPDNSHVKAFLDFARLLKPITRKWAWPDDASFQVFDSWCYVSLCFYTLYT